MDIHYILSSKPHNSHYLKRYIKFIQACQHKNINYGGYTEKHHICPKADDMFPEYANFPKNRWNCIALTPRQHIISHIILYYAYPSFYSPKVALNRMIYCNGVKINTKIFELFRKEYSKSISERYKGRESKTKGRVVVHKQSDRLMIEKEDIKYYTDNGFSLGMGFVEEELDLMRKNKGKVCINNGSDNCYIEPDGELPNGWHYGKTPDTVETRKKKSVSKLGKPNLAVKNRVSVINKETGETMSLKKGDQRLVDSNYVGINKGKKGLAEHLNKNMHECVHCGIITTKGNIKRWHDDNCKKKSVI